LFGTVELLLSQLVQIFHQQDVADVDESDLVKLFHPFDVHVVEVIGGYAGACCEFQLFHLFLNVVDS
jgi:hypothetical protein